MRSLPLLLLLLLLLPACPTGDDDDDVAQDDADDFATRLADDLADLAATAVDVASAAEDLDAREATRACYPTVGTCTFCYDVNGTPLAGTFSLEMEETPCGAAWEVAGRSFNYSVTAVAFTGAWAATGLGGDYSVDAEGEREALFATQSPRAGTHEFDSSYSMSMSAGVTNAVVTSLSVAMTYGGFTERIWEVAVSTAADGSLEGTASTDDGITCTVSAGVEAPIVRCTAPSP